MGMSRPERPGLRPEAWGRGVGAAWGGGSVIAQDRSPPTDVQSAASRSHDLLHSRVLLLLKRVLQMLLKKTQFALKSTDLTGLCLCVWFG